MKPWGVQLTSPIVPPGRQTRSSSSAAIWWWGANITPTQERTTSNAASSKGIASASASRHWTSTPARVAASRPTSKSSGVRSEATTRAPVAAAGIAALPEPAATSRTVWPARTPLARTSTAPRSGITVRATRG